MSEIFEFLKNSSLTKDNFNEKVEFLIEGFLVKQLITLIYADGGTGKSYMAFALAKKLCKEGQRVFFIDYDNPVGVLKQRGVDRLLIESYENMNYIQRSALELFKNSKISLIIILFSTALFLKIYGLNHCT